MNDQVSRHESAVVSGQRPRAAFLARTYNHVLGAIVAFVGIEIALFQTGAAASIFAVVANTSWLLVLGGFMVASWVFSAMAASRGSVAKQYVGLGGFVLSYAVLFAAPLFIAFTYMSADVVKNAALFTIAAFAVLTAIVYYTGKDFTFLRSALMWGGFLAIGLIVMSALFGFQLGLLFIVGMIGFSGASILYSTSSVLQDYPDGTHVAAALSLFSSVMMLFWYVLQFAMSMAGDD
ncbi:MAG: Bax inhibitor-1 family protein [Gammaproteobacteria bacterium]